MSAPHTVYCSVRSSRPGCHLSRGLGELLLTQRLVDVTLVCGPTRIRAHKAVLLATSAYFRRHFVDDTETAIVFAARAEVVLALVEFLYFGKTAFPSEDARAFAAGARLLEIDGLADLRLDGGERDADDPDEFPAPIFVSEIRDVSPTPRPPEEPKRCFARVPFILKDHPAGNRRRGRPKVSDLIFLQRDVDPNSSRFQKPTADPKEPGDPLDVEIERSLRSVRSATEALERERPRADEELRTEDELDRTIPVGINVNLNSSAELDDYIEAILDYFDIAFL